MMFDLLTLVGGGVLLYFGAEWLVSGAVGLALALRIPKLIVGLTVVAYGTSAPELIVGISAALSGHAEIALGNVIGSNIANLGLILGISAAICPTPVDGALPRRELPVLLLATFSVPILLWDGRVARWEGALLLLAAVVYTSYMIRSVRSGSELREVTHDATITAQAADAAGAPAPVGKRARLAVVALFGLAVLLVGGQLFVSGATELARAWGMSERMVGLTIVAIGTSLPELVTSLVAAARGHSEIAVGNVIGSNIFNVLLCLGAAAQFGEIAVNRAAVVSDVGAMILITLVGAASIRSARTMARWEGALLTSLYAAFMLHLIFVS